LNLKRPDNVAGNPGLDSGHLVMRSSTSFDWCSLQMIEKVKSLTNSMSFQSNRDYETGQQWFALGHVGLLNAEYTVVARLHGHVDGVSIEGTFLVVVS
jgi:hypothetical protein